MSKFTGLKKGLVGVCAATLLTGIVAAPAFGLTATNGGATSGGGLTSDATGTSEVSLAAADVTANISATVPTTLPVAISDGTFTAPTGAQLTNTSTNYGIVVKTVALNNRNTNLTLAEKTKATLDANEMSMTLAAGTDSTNVIDLGASPITTPSASIWKMGTGADKTIDIKVEGKMGALNGDLLKNILNSTNNKLFDVVWTIGVDL